MDRRQFIKATISGGAVIALGSSYVLLTDDGSVQPLTLDAALQQLNRFDNKTLVTDGEWDIAQIFNHCAQSVEYSMTGFPRHKADLFKNTVGLLAFSLFSLKGSMHHGLSEPIPGAPVLQPQQPLQNALKRLKKSLNDFNHYQGQLDPHFAYGALSKPEYALAHVMHLNNHLKTISVRV